MVDKSKLKIPGFKELCDGKYRQECPCWKPRGHDGKHGPREYVEPLVSDGRANHPFPAHLNNDVCSMCVSLAAHKIEDTTGPNWFHPLTNYLCCACFRMVMGAAHDSYPWGT